MSSQLSLACLALLLLPCTALGKDWGHWRGPVGNGSSPDAKPPVEWSATKNVKWKVPVPGRGSGSPVVWEDKVFVAFITSRKFMLFALLLGALHLFFMGYEGWLNPAGWNGGLPPISLVAFSIFLVGYLINFLGRK